MNCQVPYGALHEGKSKVKLKKKTLQRMMCTELTDMKSPYSLTNIYGENCDNFCAYKYLPIRQ